MHLKFGCSGKEPAKERAAHSTEPLPRIWSAPRSNENIIPKMRFKNGNSGNLSQKRRLGTQQTELFSPLKRFRPFLGRIKALFR